MNQVAWAPPGIDKDALRVEEKTLLDRLKVVQGVLRALGEETDSPSKKRKGRSRGTNTRLHQIVQVLREANKSLSVKEIYRAMCEMDPGLKWNNPAPVFRSYIRRQGEGPEQVIRTGRGLYGLKRWRTAVSLSMGDDTSRVASPRPRNTRDRVEEILRKHGGAMTVSEIVASLREQGMDLVAQNPENSLQANLTQCPTRFIRVAPRTYDLVERHGVEQEPREVVSSGGAS